jgi:3-dehydroquinate synthase
MSESICRVEVALGPRSYAILIGQGLIATAGPQITAALPGAKAALVADATVLKSHGPAIVRSLGEAGILAGEPVIVPSGEASKSFGELERVTRQLLQMGLERRDLIIALGGGMIGDLVGFAASILRRGVRAVQVPTTLLAQVDSSVGGKTGINTPEGKNLIGAFHQPSLVIADLDTLGTLPVRELRAGYAEVVKYGLLGSKAFFERLETSFTRLLDGSSPEERADMVKTCCEMKAGIVARDETETGERALLNLGHTFGHALEAAAGFSQRLLHGEAVAIGLCLASRFSELNGHCPKGTAERVERHVAAAGLPVSIGSVSFGRTVIPSALVRLMQQDKKVVRGNPTLVLLSDIGSAFISRDHGWEAIERFLENQMHG